MSDIVIPYKILEIDLFNNVETALKNINSTANVGIHLIRIKAAVERAIFDEEKDTAFEQTGPWSEELRKLNNFLKRLKDKPPTHNRIKKRIEELHEVTKYFLNTRLKISGTSGKGLSELNLGVTSRTVVWLFFKQFRFECVPVFHSLQGRLAA
jgi:hypothetical protein